MSGIIHITLISLCKNILDENKVTKWQEPSRNGVSMYIVFRGQNYEYWLLLAIIINIRYELVNVTPD